MTGRTLLLAAAALAAASPAIADPRIATRFYQPSDIVTLHGHTGIESTIAFAPDEHIENVAVGDSAAWQVTPNKRANLLFVKPMGSHARTNMTVVTDERTYLFDLVSSAGPPVYMLRFTYPTPPKPPVLAKPATTTTTMLATAAPPPKPAPDPARLDFGWAQHGDRKLLPERAFDDGHSIYLRWAKDVSLPAILVREPNGVEGPVNYTVRGDYIVVEGVPAQLILRSGKDVATLTLDHAPASDAAPPDATLTQTASAQP